MYNINVAVSSPFIHSPRVGTINVTVADQIAGVHLTSNPAGPIQLMNNMTDVVQFDARYFAWLYYCTSG